jgi:hypothetical protein
MEKKILAPECVTTNFDKLLERAFYESGTMECQPLRNADELQFHQRYPDKAYCVKIHGDYDSHNLFNQNMRLSPSKTKMAHYLEHILRREFDLVPAQVRQVRDGRPCR